MLSLLAGKVYDATKTFAFAYYCSAGLLIAAAVVTFLVKSPQQQRPRPPGDLIAGLHSHRRQRVQARRLVRCLSLGNRWKPIWDSEGEVYKP